MSLGALIALHNRLISDTAIPFESEDGRHISLTSAGLAWQKDHNRYLALWNKLERDGVDVAMLLNARFDYSLASEGRES